MSIPNGGKNLAANTRDPKGSRTGAGSKGKDTGDRRQAAVYSQLSTLNSQLKCHNAHAAKPVVQEKNPVLQETKPVGRLPSRVIKSAVASPGPHS